MKKIELPIASDYVPSWTIVDAIRELFQNAIDNAADNKEWYWSYDAEAQVLKIVSPNASLSAATLLLGKSTKAGDTSTIGQFGEGYKLATLVLLRNNKHITFKNAGVEEIWYTRFIQSKRFGCKVLGFFIAKEFAIGSDLTIEVSGITEQEWYDQIVPSNLYLRDDYNVVAKTEYGTVIDLPGKVFVNGLFVCNYDYYKYGYNFKPEHIKLDRDRKMVSDFELQWLASKLWLTATDMTIVAELARQGAADVAYIQSNSYIKQDAFTTASDLALKTFKEEHGSNAVPISTQSDKEEVPEGYEAIIVPDNYKTLIKSAPGYEEPIKEPEISLYHRFEEWYDGWEIFEYTRTLDHGDACHEEFMKLLEELKD